MGDRETLEAMPLALLPFTKAKILNKKLVFWPDKLIKVSVSESVKKPGVRGRRSGSLEGEPLAKSSV